MMITDYTGKSKNWIYMYMFEMIFSFSFWKWEIVFTSAISMYKFILISYKMYIELKNLRYWVQSQNTFVDIFDINLGS